MNIKKPLLVAGAVTTVGLAGVMGLGVASAATNSSGNNLVDKIATKFNLNKSDVQAVFDEDRAAHQAERQQKIEDRLNELVSEGKLTESQKSAILAKQADEKAYMETNKDAWKDKTRDEIHTLMQQHREELKTWAQDNNIPTEYLHFVFGFGRHGGPQAHGPGMNGPMGDDMTPPDDPNNG